MSNYGLRKYREVDSIPTNLSKFLDYDGFPFESLSEYFDELALFVGDAKASYAIWNSRNNKIKVDWDSIDQLKKEEAFKFKQKRMTSNLVDLVDELIKAKGWNKKNPILKKLSTALEDVYDEANAIAIKSKIWSYEQNLRLVEAEKRFYKSGAWVMFFITVLILLCFVLKAG